MVDTSGLRRPCSGYSKMTVTPPVHGPHDLFQYRTTPPVHLRPATPSKSTTSGALSVCSCLALAPASSSRSPLTASVQKGPLSMWRGHIVPGGPHSLLGLRPEVQSSVAQSSSSPAPPHGLQSPLGACTASCAEQSVRSEADHA